MAHCSRSLPDHARNRHPPQVEDAVIQGPLDAVVKPVVYDPLKYYRQLSLRARILPLPLVVADLDAQQWRIEEPFWIVKRFLGWSYL